MNDLKKAISIIKNGGIVIFPTDTAFGIGCRIDSEQALEKLFKIRKRSFDKAVPVLFDSVEMVNDYVVAYDEKVQKLMEKYWPGALTIILECNLKKVPDLVRGGGNTLGVRIPNNKTTVELIKGVGVPVVGTSANFSGQKTPFSLEGLDKELIKLVDFVLEGEIQGNRASTVIDCTKQPWNIIRQGDIVPDL